MQGNKTIEGAAIGELGDFNNDNLVNCDDIDLIRSAILATTSDPIFNVDGAGGDIPTEADFDFLITDIIGTGRGDGDLNKIVNFADFVLLSNNFDLTGTGWKQGNFNLDTLTNFVDFVELSNRFGMVFTSGDPKQVPEPAALIVMCVGILPLLRRCNS